jgi:hypothetical protein
MKPAVSTACSSPASRRVPNSTRSRPRRACRSCSAATQAVYETLKALREGTPPKQLKGLASGELTARVTREAEVKARSRDMLGLKP